MNVPSFLALNDGLFDVWLAVPPTWKVRNGKLRAGFSLDCAAMMRQPLRA